MYNFISTILFIPAEFVTQLSNFIEDFTFHVVKDIV